MPVVIAGEVDLFPGVYPEETPDFFVGNLDCFFDTIGAELPYRLWFRVDPSIRDADLMRDIRARGVRARSEDAREAIRRAAIRPERQGALGILSVGFASATILAVVGFLAIALASVKQRAFQLAVLRGIGLSVSQAIAYVAGELAVVLAAGLGFSSALGIGVSK
ncbi:MAG: hypothetical protein HYY04_17655 [Chloroflexi bacterium]|nr:hypothetical protein [Chloroflexota bacterium]